MNLLSSFFISNDPPQVRLMKAVRFSDTDLDDNRMGHLSENQTRRLKRQKFFSIMFYWLLSIGVLGFVMIYLSVTSGRVVWAPVAVGFVVLTLAIVLEWKDASTYIRYRAAAKTVTGRIKRRTYFDYMNRSRYWRYLIEVGGESFEVKRRVYRAFVEGERCTVYYEPSFRVIVSVKVHP